MAGPWEQFQPQSAGPWTKFGPKRDFKSENPAEYDSASPEFQAKYGAKPFNPTVAVPETLLSAGSSLISGPASGLAGIGAGISNAFGFTDTPAADVVERVGSAMTYQPRTDEGQAGMDFLSLPIRWLAKGADVAGDAVSRTPMLPSPYIPAQYAGTGAGPGAATIGNTLVQAAPAVLGGIVKPRGTPAISRGVGAGKGKSPSAAPAAPRSPGLGGVPPTIEELAAQSKAAYKRASDAGVNIAPESFATLKTRVNVTLKKEGIDPTLHPQTTAALKRINETNGVVSLDQLETLRKIANDARGAGKADGRLAGKIVDDLDDYMENIGRKDITTGDPKGFAALQEARGLYSRKMKAEEISRLIKRAEINAPNFSASGFENALRTEFRALAKNDKKMRRFTPEERAVIERVAKGGKVENALRMLGKMAPTGVVSGMFGVIASAGIPGGAALPVAGLGARYAATRMTKANALRAEETMRRGPPQKTKAKKNALIELTEQP